MERKYRCCLCGKEFKGWGNNPWPLALNEEERCCDECNDTKVIPARLRLMFERANARKNNNVEENK